VYSCSYLSTQSCLDAWNNRAKTKTALLPAPFLVHAGGSGPLRLALTGATRSGTACGAMPSPTCAQLPPVAVVLPAANSPKSAHAWWPRSVSREECADAIEAGQVARVAPVQRIIRQAVLQNRASQIEKLLSRK